MLTFGQLTVRSIGNAYRSQARSSRDDFSAAVCACPSCPASRAAVHAGPGWLLACIAVIALAACAYVGRPQRPAPLASPPRPGLTQPPESALRGDLRLWRCRLTSCLPVYGILRKELRYAVTVNRVITGLGPVPDGEIAFVDESRPGWTTCRAADLNSWPERRGVHDAEARGSRA